MLGTNENYVKLVNVSRNTKVVKGGRKFSFGAIVVAGNKAGMIGLGTGKASEVLEANEKAKNEALKTMVKIPLKEGRTIHHDVIGKFGSGVVKMRSAKPGTGIIAGGPIRAVCEAVGIKDVVVKSLGSSNPHNMIKAAIAALKATRAPKNVADKLGKKVGEIVSMRDRRTAKNVSKINTEEK